MDNNVYIWFNAITWSHSYSLSMIYKWEIFAIEFERINKIKEFPQWEWARFIPQIQREMFWNIDNQTIDWDIVKAFRNYLDDTINSILKKQSIDFWEVDKIYTLNFPFDISVRGFEDKVVKYKHNYHHLFHACSTYYPSNFDEAVILSMDHDWYDEEIEWWKNVMHTIWKAKWTDIKCIYYDEYNPKSKKVWVWTVYNLHWQICGVWEWTLMWLSWYWNNKLEHIKIFDYSSWWVFLNEKYFEKVEFWSNLKSWYDIEDFMDDSIVKNFRKIYWIDGLNIPSDIEKSIYADISDKVQTDIEEAILFLARKAYDMTWIKNICIAWGVGLNIIANNRILRETKFENIFVQPACNDAGLSLWWLYYMYHNLLWNKDRIKLISPWLWFEYSNNDILEILTLYKDKISNKKLWNNKYEIVAWLLAKDNVIWWFQWKWEFWPRALWFRSILASPISKDMKNRVNTIKEREQYRPLAPIMLEEKFQNYLDTTYPSPYMTLVARVFDNKINCIPSVVHIDSTARYQTINKEQNEKIYFLLKEFEKITWESVLINTSFNQHDEPIVESPEDSIKMFLATDMDYLFIWDYIVSKEKKYLEYKFNKDIIEKEFEKTLKKSKNNNIRGNTILKLLWISKLWFSYNYDIWDKWIKLIYKDQIIQVEVIIEGKNYYKKFWKIGLLVKEWNSDFSKILQIIEIYLNNNKDTIFSLIKWI